jgi:glycosyltransferase involved in cell wall biosynthesis
MPRKNDMSLCDELSLRKIPYVILSYYDPIYPRLKKVSNFVLFMPRLVRTIFSNHCATKKIIKLSKEYQAQLLHSNVGPIFIGYRAAKILNIPHVWHLREYQDLDFNMSTLYSKETFLKKLYDQVNHPIAISKGIVNHFSLINNAPRLIYNGILSKNDTQFIEKKEKYFLFVGRLTEGKGINALLMAFSEFKKRNQTRFKEYKLYLAGQNNEYLPALLSFVKDNNIADDVVFLGQRDDVSNLMAKAIALIVPSVYEGFGRITAEAMFNGCFVIGYDAAGTKEIIESINCGVLYKNQDELVEAMVSILEHRIESYYLMIKKGQKCAVSLFSTEQNGDEVYNYYSEILKKSVLN